MAYVDFLEGRFRIAKERASLALATISEYDPKIHAAEAAYSRTEVYLRWAELQLQLVSASEALLLEEVDKLQSAKTWLDDQCELDGQRDGRIRDLLKSASETNRIFCGNLQEAGNQNDK